MIEVALVELKMKKSWKYVKMYQKMTLYAGMLYILNLPEEEIQRKEVGNNEMVSEGC